MEKQMFQILVIQKIRTNNGNSVAMETLEFETPLQASVAVVALKEQSDADHNFTFVKLY